MDKRNAVSPRGFLKRTGVLGAGLVLGDSMPVAGMKAAPGAVLPDAAFIRDLYERGAPTAYLKSKNELRYIGMPVGGSMQEVYT